MFYYFLIKTHIPKQLESLREPSPNPGTVSWSLCLGAKEFTAINQLFASFLNWGCPTNIIMKEVADLTFPLEGDSVPVMTYYAYCIFSCLDGCRAGGIFCYLLIILSRFPSSCFKRRAFSDLLDAHGLLEPWLTCAGVKISTCKIHPILYYPSNCQHYTLII